MANRIDPFTQQRLGKPREAQLIQLGLLDYGECAHCAEYKRRIEELEATIATLAVADRQRQKEKQQKIERAVFKWRRFHFCDNAWVYDAILDTLERARNQGRDHYGIAAISEALRYHSSRLTRGSDFDFSAEHGTIYGRMVAALRPDLAYLLGLRTSDYDDLTPWEDPWTPEDEARWQAEGGR